MLKYFFSLIFPGECAINLLFCHTKLVATIELILKSEQEGESNSKTFIEEHESDSKGQS